MHYPNQIIKKGYTNKTIIKAIQKRINELGISTLLVDGDYGTKTIATVKQFQATHLDAQQNPLMLRLNPSPFREGFYVNHLTTKRKLPTPFVKLA